MEHEPLVLQLLETIKRSMEFISAGHEMFRHGAYYADMELPTGSQHANFDLLHGAVLNLQESLDDLRFLIAEPNPDEVDKAFPLYE